MEFETRQITSSFWGTIEEIPDIFVDNFNEKHKMAYFLSHAHSDHTDGLFGRMNATYLRENAAKIYMSEETNTILKHNHWHYYDCKLDEIVEPLKVGITYNIDIPDGQSFDVTLIPVTHMIGAVMFLFKTKNKTILYTGDFVIEEDDINQLKKLHDKSGNKLNIDTMYVDATFDNPDYDHFPSRSLCHNEVVDKIEEWLDSNHRGVSLFQNYQFGYDDIYKAIYEKMDMKIYEKLTNIRRLYQALYGNDNVLTGDSKSKIHICKNRTPQTSHEECGVPDSDDVYLHIYISAQRGCEYSPGMPAVSRESDRELYLCYPTHCSRRQLQAFINYFSPCKTVKFPRTAVSTPSSNASTPYRRDRERREREANADGNVKRRLFN